MRNKIKIKIALTEKKILNNQRSFIHWHKITALIRKIANICSISCRTPLKRHTSISHGLAASLTKQSHLQTLRSKQIFLSFWNNYSFPKHVHWSSRSSKERWACTRNSSPPLMFSPPKLKDHTYSTTALRNFINSKRHHLQFIILRR